MAVQGGVKPTLSVVTFSVDSGCEQNSISDDPSDKFVIYLEKYKNKKTDIYFMCLKDPGIATIDQFESFWISILSNDKYVIIVYSQYSKNNCETAMSILSTDLIKRNKWETRFIFVIIGEVDISGNPLVGKVQVVNFLLDEWENSDSDAWMAFCKFLQKASVRFDDIDAIDVDSISIDYLDEEYRSRKDVSVVSVLNTVSMQNKSNNKDDQIHYYEVKGSQNNGYESINIQGQHLSTRMNISTSEPNINYSIKSMQMDDMNRSDRSQTKMSTSDNEKTRFTSDIGFEKCDRDDANVLLAKGLKLLKIVFISTVNLCSRHESIWLRLKIYLKLIIAILGILAFKLKHFFVSLLVIPNYPPLRWLCSLTKFIWMHTYLRLKTYFKRIITTSGIKAFKLKHFFVSLLVINNYSPLRWLCSLTKFIWMHTYLRLKTYFKRIIATSGIKAFKLKHFILSYLHEIIEYLFFRWLCYLKETIFSLGPKGKISKEKPCGLKNSRETCYMNAMMQAMAASTNLTFELRAVRKDNTSNEKIVRLTDLLKIINEGHVRRNDIATEALISFMRSIQWRRTSQQDAYQLLSFCINAAQEDLALKPKIMSPKLQILHSFTENTDFNKVQDHLGLSIPLCGNFRKKPGVDIKFLINAFFAPSIIDDGPNSTSLYLFEKAPEVLILHIQANEWDDKLGMYIKPEYHIKYLKTLTYTFDIKMDKNMSKSKNIKVKYELKAVVRHMGDVSGGHYVTYRRHRNQWFLTNDEQVEAINFECQVVPYVMVYDKVIDEGCGML